MTALSVIQDSTLRIGVARPDAVFASTTREHQELASLLNECAAMIAFDSGHDWTRLKTLETITGDGASLAFDLPSDYQRMLIKATVWPSATPYTPYIHYTDTDDWLGMLSQAFPPLTGAWTLIGDQIHVRVGGSTSPIGNGDTAQYYYITNKYAKDSGGTAKTAFTADNDTFRLDERVLKLALIYRWKQKMGQDYAEEMADYENTLSMLIGRDKGSTMFGVGGKRRTALDLGVAYPGILGP